MKYVITKNGFSTLTVSRLKAGEKIYAEKNAVIASSPVYSEADNIAGIPTGKLIRRRITTQELEGHSYVREKKPTVLSQMFSDFKVNTRETIERTRIGESSYVLYEPLADNQKITFRTSFPGTILPLLIAPSEEENYIDSNGKMMSSLSSDHDMRPKGVFRAVKGSLFVSDFGVSAKVYHTQDIAIKTLSRTDDSFQEFRGKGNVFLAVNGDLLEIPLLPGESVDVWPGFLVCFSDGVTLKMTSAGDITLRNEENNDFAIRLTAGSKGGYVYVNSITPQDFFTEYAKS